MKSIECVVVGAGGLGRGVLDLVESVNQADEQQRLVVRGVLDDAPSEDDKERLRSRGYEWLGPLSAASTLAGSTRFLLGINSPVAKERIAASLAAAGLKPLTLIHPRVEIPNTTRIGEGSILLGGVELSSNVQLGRFTTVNRNAILGHDIEVSDFTSINPGAAVSGECHIGKSNLVGANSVILRGLATGELVTVGALACVTKDVPPGRTAVGVPARWAT